MSPAEKVKIYERLLHRINAYRISGHKPGLLRLLDNIDRWSYAHRSGNGMISEEEQDERISNALRNLLNTEDQDGTQV